MYQYNCVNGVMKRIGQRLLYSVGVRGLVSM